MRRRKSMRRRTKMRKGRTRKAKGYKLIPRGGIRL